MRNILTYREKKLIVEYLTQGKSSVEIAKLLGRHRNTIDRNIKKFGFENISKARIQDENELIQKYLKQSKSKTKIAALLGKSISTIKKRVKINTLKEKVELQVMQKHKEPSFINDEVLLLRKKIENIEMQIEILHESIKEILVK